MKQMEAKLGPHKIQKSKVPKIKIRSAQIVGEVYLCRRKASPPHLGPSRPIFSIGRKNPKIAQEIESAIRTKAGLISKKIEGNPAPKEKETEK